jgi:hypothetical protein
LKSEKEKVTNEILLDVKIVLNIQKITEQDFVYNKCGSEEIIDLL